MRSLNCAISLSVLAYCPATAESPRLIVSPQSPILWGETVHISAVGLATGQQVGVTVVRKDREGQLWHAHAKYEADGEGKIDVAKSAAVEGTYTGVDRLGLFWSMTPVADTSAAVQETLGKKVSPAPNTAYFALEVKGEILDRTSRSFYLHSQDLSFEEVREEELVGRLILPPDNARKTTVIWLGGSEGGMESGGYLGSLLATKGYAVLALAYFGAEGLPEELEEVPLEFFQRAIGWLQRREEIKDNKLCVVGASKGAELALLLGATFPQIQAVVAYVPASVVFQGLNRVDWNSVKSSWSYEGKPLDFLPYAYTPEFNAQFAAGQPEKINVFSLYAAALDDSEAVAKAAIPAERIQGDILLLSAGDDQLWPGSRMSEMVIARLDVNAFPHAYRHVQYEGAGHAMVGTGYEEVRHQIEAIPYVMGGTPAATARARAESWGELQTFLAKLGEKNVRR